MKIEETFRGPINNLQLLLILFLVGCNNKGADPLEKKNNESGQIIKTYYRNKALKAEYQTDKFGEKDGFYKEYYPNGKYKFEFIYRKGLLEGQQKNYYENENLKAISYYKRSKIDSVQKWYYLNGKPKSEYFWSNGNRFGAQMEYDSSGKLKDIYFISNCDTCMTSIVEFDQSGNIISKKGNLIYCVFSKSELKIGDTLKLLFYSIEPPFYNSNCNIIVKEMGKSSNSIP